MSKTATVYTNDKKRPQIKLTISGLVEKFVIVKPKVVRLNGRSGEPLKSSVTITPREKYPFKIIKSEAKKGLNIRFKLEEVKKEKVTEYLLTVENVMNKKGRYFDTVSLKTDSKIRPEIQIKVYGNISEEKKDVKK